MDAGRGVGETPECENFWGPTHSLTTPWNLSHGLIRAHSRAERTGGFVVVFSMRLARINHSVGESVAAKMRNVI